MSSYRIASLLGCTVLASDGKVGTLHDVYFSDESWALSYWVLETGTYFHDRKLLMGPALMTLPDMKVMCDTPMTINVRATRAEVLASPDYMDDPSVSDQKAHDPRLHPFFLWFPKFDGSKIASRPMGAPPDLLANNQAEADRLGHNTHLRSFVEVCGYAVHTLDGGEEKIGHVLDMEFSEHDQRLTQLLINTGLGRSGGLLLVEPKDVQLIDWSDLRLHLRLTQAEMGVAEPVTTSQAVAQ